MAAGSRMPLLRQSSSETAAAAAARARRALLLWASLMTLLNILLAFAVFTDSLRFFSSRPPIQSIKEPCNTDPECVQSAFELKGPNSSWHMMKQTPPPAQCRVRGLVIDKLEPEFNFRRAWALGYVNSPEDKSHLLMYLRALQDRAMATRERRVLLCLGAQKWDNVAWFLRNYPLDFTEIHVLEEQKGRFKKPSNTNAPDSEQNLLPLLNTQSQVDGAGSLAYPNWVLNRIRIYYNFIRNEDSKVPNSSLRAVNISKVIYKNLKLTKEDAVVVLMDIEGAEWEVLPTWMNDKDMPDIIDELFLTIHYQHPSTLQLYKHTDHSREEAARLYSQLRFKGFFVHPWS